MKADVNLNNAECIKAKTDLLTTTYYNICDGSSQVIDNGLADIMMMGLALTVITLLVGVILLLLFAFIMDL